MKSLRILFMGTPDFAVPVLHSLIEGPDTVVGLICQPDRKKGRGKKLAPPPTKVIALAGGLPVLQPTNIRTDAFLEEVRALTPDLIVVAAYGKILPGSLLNLPPMGTINVHGSLLPKYRGAAPIQWALINGEQQTGITIMQMDEGMDTGDILLQAAIPISASDTAGTLFDKMADLGGKTLVEAITRLKEKSLPRVQQDDAQTCEAPMLTKEQGHIDWNKSAGELHCLIRGLDPWPSAYTFHGGKRFRFFCPEVIEHDRQEAPGTICRADKNGLMIATGRDALLVHEIQPEGKKRMTVAACLCGSSLTVGDTFT